MKNTKQVIRRGIRFLEKFYLGNLKYDFDYDPKHIMCNLFVLTYEQFEARYGKLLRLSVLKVKSRYRLQRIEAKLAKIKKIRDSHDPWDRLYWGEGGIKEFSSLSKCRQSAEFLWDRIKQLAEEESNKTKFTFFI